MDSRQFESRQQIAGSQRMTGSQQGSSGKSFSRRHRNVSESGRWLSTLAGGVFIYRALRGRNPLLMTLLGGYLAYRGATGYCPISASLGPSVPRGNWAVSRDQGIHVEEAVVIHKSPEVLYNFWRNFENLPRFMDHLESVKTFSNDRSHWIAKAPLGQTISWDAEVIGDRANELISWRSLPGSSVANAGSVRFKPVENGQATEVRVSLKYTPPAGALGAAVAKLFGEEPGQQIRDDLGRFKQLMDSGGNAGATASGGTTGGTTGTTTSAEGATRTGQTSGTLPDDRVIEASEESFPASDPPSFSGRRDRGE